MKEETKDFELLTTSQVLSLLKITDETLSALAKKHGLTVYKLGRNNRYLKNEILSLLKKPTSND